MSVKVERTETNIVNLEFEVSAEAFEAAMQKAYIKNVKSFNIPGFRKGKAPRKIIEKMYSPAVFYDDAINFVSRKLTKLLFRKQVLSRWIVLRLI